MGCFPAHYFTLFVIHISRCGGMADANDSKSFGKPCGFDSHHRQWRPLHQAKAGTYMYRSLIGIPKGSSSDLKSGLDHFCPGIHSPASGKGRNVHVPIFDRYPEGIELGPQVRARSFLFRDPLPHMTYISSDLWSELVFCFTSYRRYGRRRRPVPGRCMRSRSGNGRGFRRRSVHPGVPRRDASRPPVPR